MPSYQWTPMIVAEPSRLRLPPPSPPVGIVFTFDPIKSYMWSSLSDVTNRM